MSSIIKRLFSISSGTFPATIFSAKPSAMAVLPTPGSPIKTGLFLVRRAKIWIKRRTSLSRPTTGSIRFSRAIWVTSRPRPSTVGDPWPSWRAPPRAIGRRFAAVSAMPIFLKTIWRVFERLSPKFCKIRAAKISSSRNSPSRICSVPIFNAPKRFASSPANARISLPFGEYGK